MKFNSLKEFWEWLTISTGDLLEDFESLGAFLCSNDFDLLSSNEMGIFWNHYENIRLVVMEQQELELN